MNIFCLYLCHTWICSSFSFRKDLNRQTAFSLNAFEVGMCHWDRALTDALWCFLTNRLTEVRKALKQHFDEYLVIPTLQVQHCFSDSVVRFQIAVIPYLTRVKGCTSTGYIHISIRYSSISNCLSNRTGLNIMVKWIFEQLGEALPLGAQSGTPYATQICPKQTLATHNDSIQWHWLIVSTING